MGFIARQGDKATTFTEGALSLEVSGPHLSLTVSQMTVR